MAEDFSGKSVLVTGAANGIGAETALAFARAGASVVLADTDEDGLRQTAEAISRETGRADAVSTADCDVSNPEQMEAAVTAARTGFGGLDIAILNAGIEGHVKSIVDLPVAEFDKVLAVNLRGVFLGLKYCIPAMRERGGGAILITSSVAGIVGTGDLAPYTTTKHGVIGLMRSAALEAAPHGIRVNTVNPCPVETRMMRALEEGFAPGHADEMHAAFAEGIPLKRYGTPKDIANLFLFLASDQAAFLTGSVYMADGGMTAGLVHA